MKTAVSIPDDLFQRADEEAEKLGVSRSKLIQVALEQYLSQKAEAQLTHEINRALVENKDFAAEETAWADFSQRTVANAIAGDDWSE